jgi:hypothetical protein
MELGWQPAPPSVPSHQRFDSVVAPAQAGPAALYHPAAGPSSYASSMVPVHQMPKGKGAPLTGTWGAANAAPNTLHYERVDRSYFVRQKPTAFFHEGRVLAVIMNETAGANATERITDYNSSSSINCVKYEDNFVYTNVRRFVVVRAKREFCYACPIFTYSGKATTKRGVRASEHGIIYSEGCQPQLLPGEVGITKPSIAVKMARDAQTLQIASRVYYGIIHPIQYNVKVKDIGEVPKDQIPFLIGNWQAEEANDSSQDARVTRNAESFLEEDEDEEIQNNIQGNRAPGYENDYEEDDDTQGGASSAGYAAGGQMNDMTNQFQNTNLGN